MSTEAWCTFRTCNKFLQIFASLGFGSLSEMEIQNATIKNKRTRQIPLRIVVKNM
jgi:hypothetical protein